MSSTWPGIEPATSGIEGQRYTNCDKQAEHISQIKCIIISTIIVIVVVIIIIINIIHELNRVVYSYSSYADPSFCFKLILVQTKYFDAIANTRVWHSLASRYVNQMFGQNNGRIVPSLKVQRNWQGQTSRYCLAIAYAFLRQTVQLFLYNTYETEYSLPMQFTFISTDDIMDLQEERPQLQKNVGNSKTENNQFSSYKESKHEECRNYELPRNTLQKYPATIDDTEVETLQKYPATIDDTEHNKTMCYVQRINYT
ncbi:hypothetical protein ANN_02772 [Periplaneta americana]|uniref:Uncharacterized protein n=1 Tax=Periplaneta americana TaxID=6978 RepID=A0ABQ8TYW7_PERAM|nr:hypothetical protein ANN_02772 [Periplaneta americana]